MVQDFIHQQYVDIVQIVFREFRTLGLEVWGSGFQVLEAMTEGLSARKSLGLTGGSYGNFPK